MNGAIELFYAMDLQPFFPENWSPVCAAFGLSPQNFEVAEEMGVAQAQVWKYLDYLGVETRSRNERTYVCDDSFFSEPNPVNSYWAGFIAADGSIVSRRDDSNRQAQMRIGIHPKDVELLEALKEASKADNPIETRSNSSGREYVYFRVSSDRWVNDLAENFNVTPNKAKTLQPPDLMGACAWAFARGYFDGDGHAQKDGKFIQITSGSLVFLEWLRELFGSHHKIYEIGDSWGVRVCGPVGRKVARRLYEGSTPDTRLDRKFLRLVRHMNTRDGVQRSFAVKSLHRNLAARSELTKNVSKRADDRLSSGSSNKPITLGVKK
jgi:hypothetical protein